MACDQPEPGLLDPRSRAVQEREFPDRGVDSLLVQQLLQAVEDRFALLHVELARLLPVETIEVGVAPVHVRPAGDDEGRRSATTASPTFE